MQLGEKCTRLKLDKTGKKFNCVLTKKKKKKERGRKRDEAYISVSSRRKEIHPEEFDE